MRAADGEAAGREGRQYCQRAFAGLRLLESKALISVKWSYLGCVASLARCCLDGLGSPCHLLKALVQVQNAM